ncbi:hypothetical protein [Asticcacaulis sp. AC402]|uniref:hypothetical protein n=1 Tax=Asticcacaulis sp. AC402 TaxID=1282361 RepID=UPI0012DCBBAC|nr:hypothetical protein [Asticcacaulis sp. AC402]
MILIWSTVVSRVTAVRQVLTVCGSHTVPALFSLPELFPRLKTDLKPKSILHL